MWQSSEKIARGERYLPPFRCRLIRAYEESFPALQKEFSSLVHRQNKLQHHKSWQDVFDMSKMMQSLDKHPQIAVSQQSWRGSSQLEVFDDEEPEADEDSSVNLFGIMDAQTFYLSQINPMMMEAMLCGQVALRFCNDENFFAMFNTTMHRLEGYPATYLTTLARAQYLKGGVQNKWAGFGLSPSQYERVCDWIDVYTAINPSREERDQAKRIDTLFPTGVKHKGRRYIISSRSIDMIKAWSERIRRDIVNPARANNMTPEEFDEPFPWCLEEVGFGINAKRRAVAHEINQGSTYIFGLVRAILEMEWPDQFVVNVFAVNLVGDPEHANGCEAIASILNGTYLLEDDPSWRGLNPAMAGGLPVNSYARNNQASFSGARRRIVATVFEDETYTATIARRLDVIESIQADHEERIKLVQALEQLNVECAQAVVQLAKERRIAIGQSITPVPPLEDEDFGEDDRRYKEIPSPSLPPPLSPPRPLPKLYQLPRLYSPPPPPPPPKVVIKRLRVSDDGGDSPARKVPRRRHDLSDDPIEDFDHLDMTDEDCITVLPRAPYKPKR